MKKAISILFACFYLAITSGFVVSIHYCMGKVSSFSIESTGADFCHSCGKKGAAHSCCSSSVKFFKVKTSHLTSYSHVKLVPPQTTIAIPGGLVVNGALPQRTYFPLQTHAPPLPSDKPAYLRNGVLLI